MISENSVVPVFFAANDYYVPYLCVAMHSLIDNCNPKRHYVLYVLSNGLSKRNTRHIINLRRNNVDIEVIKVADLMEDKRIFTGERNVCKHLTVETTFRLLVDKIFPQYEKILYLDSDIVVLRDVAELFDINIEGAILGASRSNLHQFVVDFIKSDLHIPVESYFNAGILIINIKKFREHKIGETCLNLLQEEKVFPTMDQDVLNLTCNGHVKYIDRHWNVEWQYLAQPNNPLVMDDYHLDTYELIENPYIIHFTSGTKPWDHPEMQLAEMFWYYARQTVFYEEILMRCIEKRRPKPATSKNPIRRHIFPWDLVDAGEEIVIYGYGVVGKSFLEQILLSRYCIVKAVCDRQYQSIKNAPVPVIDIEHLKKQSFSKIVIAIEDKNVASEIQTALMTDVGISRNNIVWKNYLAG